MSAETSVERGPHGHVRWTPALLAAITEDREAGMSWESLEERYGIARSALRNRLQGVSVPSAAPSHAVHRETAMIAVPPTPVLPCGCYRGHPCERARELAAAMGRERWGSREWAIARLAWIRHQAEG